MFVGIGVDVITVEGIDFTLTACIVWMAFEVVIVGDATDGRMVLGGAPSPHKFNRLFSSIMSFIGAMLELVVLKGVLVAIVPLVPLLHGKRDALSDEDALVSDPLIMGCFKRLPDGVVFDEIKGGAPTLNTVLIGTN